LPSLEECEQKSTEASPREKKKKRSSGGVAQLERKSDEETDQKKLSMDKKLLNEIEKQQSPKISPREKKKRRSSGVGYSESEIKTPVEKKQIKSTGGLPYLDDTSIAEVRKKIVKKTEKSVGINMPPDGNLSEDKLSSSPSNSVLSSSRSLESAPTIDSSSSMDVEVDNKKINYPRSTTTSPESNTRTEMLELSDFITSNHALTSPIPTPAHRTRSMGTYLGLPSSDPQLKNRARKTKVREDLKDLEGEIQPPARRISEPDKRHAEIVCRRFTSHEGVVLRSSHKPSTSKKEET